MKPSEQIDLSIDSEHTRKVISFRNFLFGGLVVFGIGATVTPLLFKHQARSAKTLSLLSGLLSCSAACLMPLEYHEKKLLRIYNKSIEDNYSNQLTHEKIRVDAIQQITETQKLAQHLERNVPDFQLGYWANKFELVPLISKFFISSDETVPDTKAENDSFNFVGTPNIIEAKYNEPKVDNQWLLDIVAKTTLPLEQRSHQHLKIDGGSQSGKSTLVSFIVYCISYKSQEIEINLVDPKYPMSQWQFKPQFKGYEMVERGVDAAIQELEIRKKLSVESVEKNQELPSFKRYLLIVDEWDSIWGNGKGYGAIIDRKAAEKIKNKLTRVLKESASYNMSLVLIGQSPLTTDIGFSRSSLNSATRIVLGNEALKWVNDPGFPFKNAAASLANELEDWIEAGNRVALIVPNIGSKPSVQPIPIIDLSRLFVQQKRDFDKDFLAMESWVKSLPEIPTPEEISAKWKELTEMQLTPQLLTYLIEKLNLK